MEFLIVVFGGIWLLYKWIREESQGAANRAIYNKAESERNSYKPDDDTDWIVNQFVEENKNEALMSCKQYLLPIYGESEFEAALKSYNWYVSPISHRVVKAMLLAKKGMYEPYLPIRAGADRNITSTTVIEYYHQIENILHKAGKTNAKFYLRLSRDGKGEPMKYCGFVRYGDEFVMEQQAKYTNGCIRLW